MVLSPSLLWPPEPGHDKWVLVKLSYISSGVFSVNWLVQLKVDFSCALQGLFFFVGRCVLLEAFVCEVICLWLIQRMIVTVCCPVDRRFPVRL